MRIPVTQELIDSVKHSEDGALGFGHFPCLTERAIEAVVGFRVGVCAGNVRDDKNGDFVGTIDAIGSNYQHTYDAHRWDEIQPGEFEYTPEGEVR